MLILNTLESGHFSIWCPDYFFNVTRFLNIYFNSVIVVTSELGVQGIEMVFPNVQPRK